MTIVIRDLTKHFWSKMLIYCASIAIAAFPAIAQSDGAQQNKVGRNGVFAITNAKIVTVSGPVIENGIVILQDGKIAGVGAGIAIPRGAEVIDGKGMSVYPGMIDSGTNM